VGPADETKHPQDCSLAVHDFYQHLSEDIRDNFGLPGDDYQDPSRWVNYQAFLANLLATGVFHQQHPILLFHAMEGACEDPHDHEKESPAERDAWVLGAAQWILWYGQGLFKLILWPGDWYDDEKRRHEACRWPDEKWRQFTLRNWHAWRDRFRHVAGSDGFGYECKTVAGKAADTMDVLERGMSA
jgi:Protein of unknown function (DUF3632)